jgi:hypothetical protein
MTNVATICNSRRIVGRGNINRANLLIRLMLVATTASVEIGIIISIVGNETKSGEAAGTKAIAQQQEQKQQAHQVGGAVVTVGS